MSAERQWTGEQPVIDHRAIRIDSPPSEYAVPANMADLVRGPAAWRAAVRAAVAFYTAPEVPAEDYMRHLPHWLMLRTALEIEGPSSPRVGALVSRVLPIEKCQGCGKPFLVYRYDGIRLAYCSLECRRSINHTKERAKSSA